jgi:hypothetical protein
MKDDDPTYLDRVAKMLRLGGQAEASNAALALKKGPPSGGSVEPESEGPTEIAAP